MKQVGLIGMQQKGNARRERYRHHRNMAAIEFVSGCLKKSRYPTYGKASRVARKVFNERGIKLRIYFCPSCLGYHLTKKGLNSETN